jgi:hypothetical protein
VSQLLPSLIAGVVAIVPLLGVSVVLILWGGSVLPSGAVDNDPMRAGWVLVFVAPLVAALVSSTFAIAESAARRLRVSSVRAVATTCGMLALGLSAVAASAGASPDTPFATSLMFASVLTFNAVVFGAGLAGFVVAQRCLTRA